MNWSLYLNFVAAMLAIVNPVGVIPLWTELTYGETRKVRSEVALMLVGSSTIILLIFLLFGRHILGFFSIDLDVFRIAGGILLLSTGISMVYGDSAKLHKRKEQLGETPLEIAKNRFKDIMVPMAIPILSGPGSITTVVLFNSKAEMFEYLGLSVVLIIVMLTLYFFLLASRYLERKVDMIVFNGITRLLGIIVVAIAVQFVVGGLKEVFPGWG